MSSECRTFLGHFEEVSMSTTLRFIEFWWELPQFTMCLCASIAELDIAELGEAELEEGVLMS